MGSQVRREVVTTQVAPMSRGGELMECYGQRANYGAVVSATV